MTQQSATSQQQNSNDAPRAVEPDLDQPIMTIARLSTAMDQWSGQLTKVAPKGRPLDVKRFKAIVMSCASRTPKLVLCSVYSLRQAVTAAAELGFELGGVSGEAYLIPYENRKKIIHPNNQEEWITVVEATFMPGYKGFLRLARESGHFRDLGSDVIRLEDVWEPLRRGPEKLQWGHIQGEPTGPQMMQIPKITVDGWGQRRKETRELVDVPALRGAYAYAKLIDPAADDIVRVIWKDRLEAIRLRSKAGNNGPWITDYAEMAQKTAIRNLWKHLPKSEVMERALALDNEFQFEDTQRDGRTTEAQLAAAKIRAPELLSAADPSLVEKPAVDPAKGKTDRVADKVKARAAQATAPAAPASRPAQDPQRDDHAPAPDPERDFDREPGPDDES